MSEWKKYKLGEVCEFINGRAYKANEFRESGTPIVRIQNLTGIGNTVYSDLSLPENKYINKGDLIYAWSATFGPYIWRGPKSIYHYHIWKIECNESLINKNYYYYFLLNTSDKLKESGNGTLFIHITKELMESFQILLPPLSEQTAIAEVLSCLDDKIDLLHRQNKTLEQLAETLFRQWFVEEAEESWEERGLDEIAEFLNGLACQKFPRKSGETGLPVIKIKEMRTGITESSDCATADVPEKYIIENGDMLFSWSGSLDIVLWFGGKGVLNQHLFKVSSDKYPQWFYYFWTQFHLQEFKGIADDKATTMGHIQRHHLTNARVVVPTKEEIQKMDETINPLFHKIKSNTQQIRTLTQLRDTLLPKLMSGEVRVKI